MQIPGNNPNPGLHCIACYSIARALGVERAISNRTGAIHPARHFRMGGWEHLQTIEACWDISPCSRWGLVMGTSQGNWVGLGHFLEGGRMAGGIMHNDTRPCTSGALGETRTPPSCSLSHPQSSWVCRKLLGAGISHTWDQALSLTGGWWIYPSISTSVFTLHTVLVELHVNVY